MWKKGRVRSSKRGVGGAGESKYGKSVEKKDKVIPNN